MNRSDASDQLSLLGGLDGILSGPGEPETLEQTLADANAGPVVAIDEAGRGPLAGPVVAGAVIFKGPCRIAGVDDSKRLTPKTRAALVPEIQRAVLAWAVGEASAEEIDEINILEATRLAAMRAIEALRITPAVALTDALTLPRLSCPVVPIVRGDARVRAIGAASILAKEHRDQIMRRLDREWPLYGLAEHFGYPTPLHRARLREHGPSTGHRLSFRGAEPHGEKPLVPSAFFEAMTTEISAAPAEDGPRLRRRITRRRALLPRREIDALLEQCSAR